MMLLADRREAYTAKYALETEWRISEVQHFVQIYCQNIKMNNLSIYAACATYTVYSEISLARLIFQPTL